MGNLQDGTYFRRLRPFVEGTYWENGEYRLIFALENMQYGTAGLDEFWVGAKDIPVVNMCRIGHVKDPLGLEGDMTSSSRCMTFMERSSMSQAIELDQNFLTGIWFANTFFDERASCQIMAGRPDQGLPPALTSATAKARSKAVSLACRCMKTKAGTSCTWALRSAGAMASPTATAPT